MAAFSGLSEPWTELASIDSAKSFRMVPSAASAGFVAPMVSRFFAIVLTFKNLQYNRTRGHECNKVIIKWTLGMHRIESLGLGLAQLLALLANNPQATAASRRELI